MNSIKELKEELEGLINTANQLVKVLQYNSSEYTGNYYQYRQEFSERYQEWYTKSLLLIEEIIPFRYEEFKNLYHNQNGEYNIEDYVQGSFINGFIKIYSDRVILQKFQNQKLILQSALSVLSKMKSKNQKLTDENSQFETTFENNSLLNIGFNDFFYGKLEEEINACYMNKAFTGTIILSRKLIENLLIDILRKRYSSTSKENLDVYFNTKKGQFHDFITLIKNLEEKQGDFVLEKVTLNEFLCLVKPFRLKANANTHSIVVVSNRQQIEEQNIPTMVALLKRILENMSINN